MSFATWEAMADELRKPFKGQGTEVTRSRRAVIEFGQWAHAHKVPMPVPVDMEADVLEQFGKDALDVYRLNGKLNLDGQACLDWAKKMMQRSREEAADAGEELEVEAPSHEEKLEQIRQTQEREMAEREVEVEEGEELEGVEGEEQFEEEEEEQPAPRKRGRPVQPKVIVQMPKNFGRTPRAAGEPRARGGLNAMLPRTTTIRIFKRDEDGRRQAIDDYTSDEIGDMDVKKFVEKYIDEKHGNAPDENGIATTEYTIFELDQRGREKPGPAVFTLRVEVGQPQGGSEPTDQLGKSLSTLKRAKQVLSEFEEEDPRKPYFEEAQRQAAGKGDMQQMMMLAMMEKLFSQNTTSRSDRMLELILERTGLVPPRDAGPMAMMPPMPPPNWGPPPPLPVSPPSAIDKVLEVAIARMASPGPSFADQMKDMLTFQQMMGGVRQGDPQLTQALSDLAKQMRELQANQGRAPGSLEETVAGFEKIQTLVKSLAPEVGGAGGIGGFIKGLLTPEVGSIIAAAIKPPEQGQKPQTPGTPAPPDASAPAPAPARDPRKPPNPTPKAVVEALNAFKMAQTREHQVERFIDVVFAMYMTQDPFYLGFLGPAFEALNQADKSAEFLKTPRVTAMRLLAEMRPELADPAFVDATLASMAMRAGAKLPETLTSTTGSWTVDFRGNFMPLEKVGPPVESTPPYVPQPPPEFRAVVASAPSVPATTAESLSPAPNDLPPPPVAVPDPAPTATAN